MLNDNLYGVIFPFLFGISIPIANWKSVRYKKMRSLITLGIISASLFYGTAVFALGVSNIHFVLSFVAVGLSGVGFLFFNSAFISSIKVNRVTATVTFILVSISLPIGKELLKLTDISGIDYTFLFSTFMTILGLCSSGLSSGVKDSKNEMPT